MDMAEDKTNEAMTQEWAAADSVIEQFQNNLEKMKKDPKKKRQFVEDFVKAHPEQKGRFENLLNMADDDETPSLTENNDTDLLNDSEVKAPGSEKSSKPETEEDDEPQETKKPGKRRVIPRGDPDDLPYEEADEEQKNAAEKGSSEEKAVDALITDSEYIDDARRLFLLLKDAKIKNIKYIIKEYFKRYYANNTRAATSLNNLLKDVQVTPRQRLILLKTYYEISPKIIEGIIEQDTEDDDEEISSKKSSKELDDSDEVVDIAARDDVGSAMTDKNGNPIYIKMRKKDIRLMQTTRMLGGGSSRGGDSLAIAEMLSKQQTDSFKVIGELRQRETDFWKGASRVDQMDTVRKNIQQYKDLGLVSANIEKPSEYQKVVVAEVRQTMKEGFSETKGEFKAAFDVFREEFGPSIRDALSNTKKSNEPKESNSNSGSRPVEKLPEKEIDNLLGDIGTRAAKQLTEDAKRSKKK
jgi:hypothetical protein